MSGCSHAGPRLGCASCPSAAQLRRRQATWPAGLLCAHPSPPCPSQAASQQASNLLALLVHLTSCAVPAVAWITPACATRVHVRPWRLPPSCSRFACPCLPSDPAFVCRRMLWRACLPGQRAVCLIRSRRVMARRKAPRRVRLPGAAHQPSCRCGEGSEVPPSPTPPSLSVHPREQLAFRWRSAPGDHPFDASGSAARARGGMRCGGEGAT